MPPSRILLIGMMGAGKSAVGAVLAARLGWARFDSDEQIEHRTGTTVARIFAERGEAAFRVEEAAALAEALAAPPPAVISVAGGAVLSAANRELLGRAGLVVWLRASLPVLAERVVGGDHRPLLEGDRLARLTQLYAERQPYYQQLADTVIDVDSLLPDAVADQVIAAVVAASVVSVGEGGPDA